MIYKLQTTLLNYFPKYFTNKAIQLYIIVLIVVSVIFFRFTMQWYMFEFGLLEVVGFFYFSNILSKKWSRLHPKTFENKLFISSLVIRLVWVVFSYFFYVEMTGVPFEFGAADSQGYNYLATEISRQGYSSLGTIFQGMDFADRGYATYLGTVYMIFGNVVIIPRFLKAFWGAWSAVLVYRVASRSFGERVGRIAAIFFMLMPNLIYYCGLHLKEVEMVFLIVAFIERADNLLRSKKNTFLNIFLPLLLAAVMFTFRSVLGLTALFSLFTALMFSSKKILGFGQRFIIGIWVVAVIGFLAGGKIATEVEQLWRDKSTQQEGNMEWRSVRENGNKFAKKASFAVFAPAILIIPIPTMVDIEFQMNQQLINGGNFDKEILAFFVFLSLIWVIKNRKWRDFTLIGSFMIGYLMVIAMSSFAQSERFHQPALPFILMFAAFGITKVTNKSKKYYLVYLILLFFVIIAWSWFKLAGRELV